MKIKLTQSIVNNAECDNEKRITVWDSMVPGLYLRVGKRKVYYIYYRLGQVQRRYKLGSADILSLTEARIRARELLGKVAAGVDVAEQKMKKPTIKDVINEYDLYAMNTIRGAKSVISMLRHICEPILNRPITSLSLSWYEARRMDGQKQGYKNSSLNTMTANLKRLVHYAMRHGYLKSDPLLGLKKLSTRQVTRVKYLTAEEEQRLIKAVENQKPYLVPMIIFSINTGLRKTELLNLKWADIDFRLKQLEIEATHAKTGRTRYIPLNHKALEVLKSLKRTGTYVFRQYVSYRQWKRITAAAETYFCVKVSERGR